MTVYCGRFKMPKFKQSNQRNKVKYNTLLYLLFFVMNGFSVSQLNEKLKGQSFSFASSKT